VRSETRDDALCSTEEGGGGLLRLACACVKMDPSGSNQREDGPWMASMIAGDGRWGHGGVLESVERRIKRQKRASNNGRAEANDGFMNGPGERNWLGVEGRGREGTSLSLAPFLRPVRDPWHHVGLSGCEFSYSRYCTAWNWKCEVICRRLLLYATIDIKKHE